MARQPATACPVTAALAANDGLRPWFLGQAPGRLWVAFSGGADSTALLHGLRGVADLRAIHIDHGLHEDSPAWARHCAEQADALGATFECHRVCLRAAGNREAEARRARYAVWAAVLRPGEVLALAHHADDQAETRLWQLFSGRTPGGMPAGRALGAGRILRPLLAVRRSALRAYAKEHGLKWLEDPANADLRHDRSYLRQQVLPAVEARFPEAVALLGRNTRPGADGPVAPLPAAAASAAQVEAWLAAAGLPLGGRAIAEVARQSAAAAHRNPRVAICPGTFAWRYQGAWHLVRQATGKVPPATDTVAVGTDASLPAGTLRWRSAACGLPPGLGLRICRRRGGERMRPAGRNIGKTVKALFQEHRIPPWLREAWPLLWAADAEQKLLAVPELAVAASAAVGGGLRPVWQPRVRMLSAPLGGGPFGFGAE